MTDRRRFPRVPVHRRCWCESDNITIYAQMGNVCEEGAFVRTFSPLREGSHARVRFVLEDGSELEADATVVWRCDAATPGDSVGMGLRFDRVEERLREALKRWLAIVGEGPERSSR